MGVSPTMPTPFSSKRLYISESIQKNTVLYFLHTYLDLWYLYIYRQTMVHGMQEIDKHKIQMQDVQVPLEVFE